MNKVSRSIVLSGICGVLLCSVFPTDAYAGMKKIKLKTGVKFQYTSNANSDLDTVDAETTAAQIVEGKVTLYGDINDDFSFLTQARAVKNYGEGGGIDGDTGEASGTNDFVELRQYWLEYDGLAEVLPFSVRVGRQRIREDRSLWWNRDLDAVSLIYDATLFSGFLTVGQNLGEYRSSKDAYNEDDKQILRILGQTSWQWKQGHVLEARFAHQRDRSGLDRIGSLIMADDRDDQDADLFWYGVRAAGEVNIPTSKSIDSFSYRADLIALTGEQDTQTSTNNGDGTRTVTAHGQQDVSGWAVDVGVDVTLPIGKKPVFSLGYAHGSGDDDLTDNDDKNFRQTGLDGNTSKMLGSSGSFYNYGSVLRPDLSNIHILTAGLNVPVMKDSNVAFVYHYYRLAEDATSLATSGISASLNGTDRELGQAVDVIINTNISEELNITHKGLDRVGLKTTLGMFQSGSAYGAAEDEFAYRAQVDLNFRF